MHVLMMTAALHCGGAETHLYELCRALQKEGHRVTVAAKRGTLTPAFAAAGIETLPCAIGGRTPLPLALLWDFFRLLRYLRRHEVDVLHAHARPCALLGAILSRLRGVPMVTTLHAAYAAHPLSRALTCFGEATLAVSADLARHAVTRFHQAQKRLILTRNGVDCDRFSPSAATRTPFRVVALCRMEEDAWTGAWLLAQSAPYLCAKYCQIRIFLAGEGSLLPRLRRLCRKINADLGEEVLFCVGNVTDPAPFLAAAEVAVVSSRAALEALACGCGVVAAGVYGFGGLLDAKRCRSAIATNFTFRGRGFAAVSLISESILEFFGKTETQKEAMRQENRAFVIEEYATARMAQDALRAYRLANAPQILLHGYYGYGNFGDEVSRRAICAQLHENGYRVLVAARHRREYQRQTGEKCCCRVAFFALRRCRALLFGGGTLLQNETSRRSLRFYLAFANAALRQKKRVLFYANGLGPLYGRSAQGAVARLLRRDGCRLLCRDRRSYALAQEMGCKSLALCDDAVSLLPCAPSVLSLPQGFSTRLWKNTQKSVKNGQKSEKTPLFSLFAPCLGRFCDRAAMERACENARGARFFLPLHPQDLPLCRDLAHRFGGEVLSLSREETLIALLAHPFLDRAYGQRYHFLYYAKRIGAPFLALSASPKILALLEE